MFPQNIRRTSGSVRISKSPYFFSKINCPLRSKKLSKIRCPQIMRVLYHMHSNFDLRITLEKLRTLLYTFNSLPLNDLGAIQKECHPRYRNFWPPSTHVTLSHHPPWTASPLSHPKKWQTLSWKWADPLCKV